ncbi:MAG TPA: N-acetylmuramoyl-L-alanine amidase [Thermodesulfobacteriota bacterium]|nr:N-acetylmuramoyl-L-alanine amidase [Thermodesulfobacteriota bacterium]
MKDSGEWSVVSGHGSVVRKGLMGLFLLFTVHCSLFTVVTDSEAAITGHAAKKTPVRITGIKYSSNPNYTRVVISLSNEAAFSHHLLKEDPNINKPRRFYVDIKNASLSRSLKQPTAIDDVFVKMVRAGWYTKDTVRVVLDIKSIEDHKIFSLPEPFRIVIDITGKKQGSEGAKSKIEPAKPTLAQQLGLKIKRIVIDAGHGGKDPGAIGKGGLKEKDIVLKIASGLRESLASLGAEIIMTRSDDTFIPLEERAAIANTKEADLFISIHVNASHNRKASGVETYFLNLTNDARAMRVAARENAVSTKKMSDLQYILNDLMKTAKTNESSRLAAAVQGSLVSNLKTKYSDIKGNGVKGAPFYVLVGTHMPSILVEVSFVSNPTEEKRLADNGYIKEIIAGITNGVNRYVKEMEVSVE